MKKVAILTDSTAYLPSAHIEENGISSVPLNVIWGEDNYQDGITISPAEFYAKLKTARVMPSTSQPSVGVFQKAFSSLLEQDFDVLGIFISGKLSGTVHSAMQARDLVEKGREKIEIIDSQNTTVSMGLQVLVTARLAGQGASLVECKQFAEQTVASVKVYFVVDTLEFLHRGGRIGGAQRFLGTALNMKPILTLREGKIEAQERIRTKGKALDRIVDLVAEFSQGKGSVRLAASHAVSEQDARAVLAKASARLAPAETFVTELSPVIGTHVGPGTVALACMAGI
jgi:DegV family protein with EDD domain